MSDNLGENSMIVEKTTIVKTGEPFSISVKAFAGGHKVEFKYKFDPMIEITLDQLEKDLATSQVKRAIRATHDLIEAPLDKGGLASHVLTDEDVVSKALEQAAKKATKKVSSK